HLFIQGACRVTNLSLSKPIPTAIQATPLNQKSGVRLQAKPAGTDAQALQIEVQDNGSGFSREAAAKAASPFYTTRNVGLGLGLTVTRKIIETHHGKLEILDPKPGQAGLVRISLPITAAET